MNEETTSEGNQSQYTTGTLFDYSKKKSTKNALIADEISAEVIANTVKTFEALNLHPNLIASVNKLGWKSPTPVQGMCLPLTTQGRDVAGFAQTGTGKTGVFLLTLAQRLLSKPANEDQKRSARAVVLAPTRELAMQISDDAKSIFEPNNLKITAVFGGVDYEKQAKLLQNGIDVIVATPGRLKDYVQKKIVDLSQIEVFICDEADRMFDMGFIEDVEFFLDKISEDAQKLLFSATTNDDVKELAFEYLNNPEYISVNPEEITPEKIIQKAIHVNATNKLQVMLGLLKDQNPECAIIFTNTKLTAEWLAFKLEGNGVEVDLMSGSLPQSKRIQLIKKIKEGKINALIATDVASRGLHIKRVSHVYNFDIPDDPSNYIHRIGRTARAGAKGMAVSLVCDDYGQNFPAGVELLGDSAHFQSEWYDAKYLEIEDKAGNPFEGREREKHAPSDRPSRGQNESRSHQKPDRSRQGARTNQGNSNKPSEHKGKKAGTRNRDQDRNRNNKNPNQKKTHNKPQHSKSAANKPATSNTAAAKSNGSVGGLFKKMIKSIFGK